MIDHTYVLETLIGVLRIIRDYCFQYNEGPARMGRTYGNGCK